MVAGFLHDVVEDSNVTLGELVKWGFSQEVVAVVELLTHKKEDTYIKYIEDLCLSGNMDAIAVKISDLKHNIARGEAGRHTKSVKTHQEALERLITFLGYFNIF